MFRSQLKLQDAQPEQVCPFSFGKKKKGIDSTSHEGKLRGLDKKKKVRQCLQKKLFRCEKRMHLHILET